MREIYDNWGKLVEVVLRREHDRELALADSSSSSSSSSLSDASLPLKIFTFWELQTATKNFRMSSLLGKGRLGWVYKGYVDEITYEPVKLGYGMPVAVKSTPFTHKTLSQWQAQINLGKLSHPNIVKLLGYCSEDGQLLLVYEYMQKRSLDMHLYGRCFGVSISWQTWIKIAIGIATGLSFLHTLEMDVIWSDLNSANILLDEEFNAKLSDFGVINLDTTDDDSHTRVKLAENYGYTSRKKFVIADEVNVKSDVYNFGRVLLEIIGGRQAIYSQHYDDPINIVEWGMPLLRDKTELKQLMHQYPSTAAHQIANLILSCCGDHQTRPTMEQVLDTLDRIISISS